MDIAVTIDRHQRQPGVQRVVDQRQVHDQRAVELVVIAERHADLAFQLLARPVGLDQQRTTGGVLAEQRALGSAQHLHRADIVHVQQGAVRARDIDAIEVDAHPGVDVRLRVALPDAAYIDIGDTGDAVACLHFHAGNGLVEVGNIEDSAACQLFTRKSRHRDRCLLQVLLAFSGGDHDLLESETAFLGKCHRT